MVLYKPKIQYIKSIWNVYNLKKIIIFLTFRDQEERLATTERYRSNQCCRKLFELTWFFEFLVIVLDYTINET